MTEENKLSTKYVMVESSPSMNEDEIDLFGLIRHLLQAWKTILWVTVICAGSAAIYSLRVPEVFKAEALLAPASEENTATSSALRQFGGLAAMAGISIPSNTNTERVLATFKTREFLKEFVKKNDLLPIIFCDYWDATSNSWVLEEGQDEFVKEDGVKVLQEAISIEEKSGLICLSVSWESPKFAAKWANDLVRQLNEQLRVKAISNSHKKVGYLEKELAKTTLQDMRTVLYSLLESEKQSAMLANVNEDFALEVVDPAVVPEFREKPNRKLIVVLGGVLGFFLGIFAVFFGQFLKKLKSSSEKVHS